MRAFTLCSLCMSLFVRSHCLASVLEVGPDKPYETVAAAVRAGSRGDTVLIHPGVYLEAGLGLWEDMTLAGAGGGTTVLAYQPASSYGEILGCAPGVVIRDLWLVGAPREALIALGDYSFELQNCVIWANTTVIGQPHDGWRITLTNCTVFGNDYGIVCEDGCSAVLRNTIVHGNEFNLVGSAQDITATHCAIGGAWPGEGNIDTDPMFVNEEELDWLNVYPWPPDVGAIKADLRLRPDSPCIDAGLNDPGLPGTDIAGMHRIIYGGKSLTVDMGAYEFYINDLLPGPQQDETTFTWSSLAEKTYSIFYTEDLLTWHVAVEDFPSAGNQTTSWIDDGTFTGVPPSLARLRFYRVLENP